MSRALVETGIGATRALVLDGDALLEAHFERDDAGPLPGAVADARVAEMLVPGHRAVLAWPDGAQVLLEPAPGAAKGKTMRAEITRAAGHEAGRPRLAKARPTDAAPAPGMALAARLAAAGHAVVLAQSPQALTAAGWDDMVEQALSGHIPFPGGSLTISPTPAMTVVDVDGPGLPDALALAAVPALAAAIRRLGLNGNLVVDFPSITGRAARAAVDAALAAALPVPFEKTAINGFGLVQIIRPRRHPSLLEAVRTPGFAGLALLRRAGAGLGAATLTAHPAVIQWLAARPSLVAALARQRGGSVALAEDPRLGVNAGHAQ